MRKPVIGIGRRGPRKPALEYARAVARAGGNPRHMPMFITRREARAFIDRVDGLVLIGGADINPRRWGEKWHPKAVPLDPRRERNAFLAIEEALRQDKPILAVCCGCQELNVALGGSIIQHIYDRPRVRPHSDGVRHAVAVTPGSILHGIVGVSRLTVNSYHHQACGRLGRGLRIAAKAADGVIEAIESRRHRFAVGLQWHPERMQGDRRQRAVFKALMAKAGAPPPCNRSGGIKAIGNGHWQ